MAKGKSDTRPTNKHHRAKQKQGIEEKPQPLTFGDQQVKDVDEFLFACVEKEEAAEKWRAGDAAKSARFYTKAIDMYSEGLALFPKSFDLQYNKARAQYTITQFPAIRREFPVSAYDLLLSALESHRDALKIEPSNPDALFNTAQVLTSLADVVVDEADEASTPETPGVAEGELASRFLEEAIEHLVLCYNIQLDALKRLEGPKSESSMDQAGAIYQDQHDTAANGDQQSPSQDSKAEVWASIEEPVTASSLVDTRIALAESLAGLCQLVPSTRPDRLSQLEELSQSMLHETIHPYLAQVDQLARSAFDTAMASLRATFLDTAFSTSRIDFKGYDSGLTDAFRFANVQDPASYDPKTLCAHAEALISFATSTAKTGQSSATIWSRLDKALSLLDIASKTSTAANVGHIHFTRGDAEMLRFSLSFNHDMPQSLANERVRLTLTTNAQKYYRGAKLYAGTSTFQSDPKDLQSARIREAIAAMAEAFAKGQQPSVGGLRELGLPEASIRDELLSMAEDFMLPPALLAHLDRG